MVVGWGEERGGGGAGGGWTPVYKNYISDGMVSQSQRLAKPCVRMLMYGKGSDSNKLVREVEPKQTDNWKLQRLLFFLLKSL